MLLKAKYTAGEVLENGVFLGLIAGAVLGLILFFNLPSLESLLVRTAGSSVGFGALGLAVERRSVKLAAPIILLGVLVGLFWLFHSAQCLAYQVPHSPAENSITGEVVENGFNGFRLKACDKGSYPWYFEGADQDDLQESGIDADDYYPPPPEVELRLGYESNGFTQILIYEESENRRVRGRRVKFEMFYSRPGEEMQSAKEFSQDKAFESHPCSGSEAEQGLNKDPKSTDSFELTSFTCNTSVPFPDHDRPLQLRIMTERNGESKTDSATCQPPPNASRCRLGEAPPPV